MTVAEAILATEPALNPLVARAHAAALIAIVQTITDRIGAAVLADDVSERTAEAMRRDAHAACDDLDRHHLERHA